MANIIDIPVSQRARARESLRERFGADADIEPWLERWVGTFENLEVYVAQELEEILPPRDQWLAAYIDSNALARDWEDCCRAVYGRDRKGRVHVFAWHDFHAMDPAESRDSIARAE